MAQVFTLLVTVILPIILWLRYLRWTDRDQPEPLRFSLSIFITGVLAAIIGILIEVPLAGAFGVDHNQLIDSFTDLALAPFVMAVIMITFFAAIEEIIKAWVLKERVYNAPVFDQIGDGFYYGVTLALGFSFAENILYFFGFLATLDQTAIFIASTFRSLATTLLHLTATGIFGLALAKKKFSPEHSKSKLWLALLYAILLHAAFNILIGLGWGVFIALPLLLFIFIRTLKQATNFEARLIWRLIKPAV